MKLKPNMKKKKNMFSISFINCVYLFFLFYQLQWCFDISKQKLKLDCHLYYNFANVYSKNCFTQVHNNMYNNNKPAQCGTSRNKRVERHVCIMYL